MVRLQTTEKNIEKVLWNLFNKIQIPCINLQDVRLQKQLPINNA